MEILAYGVDGEQKTGLSNFLSATWTRWGWQGDEAEVVIPATQIAAAASPDGTPVYTLRGYPAHNLVLVFEQTAMRLVKATITSGEDSKAGAEARLMCRQPTHTRPRRIVVPPSGQGHDTFSGPAESALKHYVDTQLVNPADPDRAVPNFVVAADTAAGRNVKVQGRYQDLSAVLDDAAKVGGVGHTVEYVDGQFVFETYAGANRTNEVEVAISQGTADSEELLSNVGDATNHAYVGGQGDLELRTIVQAFEGVEKTGWQRSETWVDGRDTDDADTLSDRGKADLAPAEFATEVGLSPDNLTVGTDFDLMDQLRYRNVYGLDKTVRVVGVTKTVGGESAVPTVTVHLDRPWPHVDRRESALSGAQIQ